MSNLVSPWGVCRFIVQAVAPPASVTLGEAETAVWTFSAASAAFGTGAITLAPSASPCTATLALGSFGNAPYQLLALATRFTLGWAGSGIGSASVDLVGADGSAIALATAPGTYAWPAAPADAKYAGTWGQDFGVGFTASDHGSDALPNGISAAEMASAQTDYAFQLPLGFTAAELRFTFTLTDATQPISLAYPVLGFPVGPPAVIQETGDTAAVLYPNGPGVRFGSWRWWNGAWQNPPAVRPFGQTSTVLDWLAWKRVVTTPEAADAGLDAELAALYDAVQQAGRGDVASGTTAFLLAVDGGLAGVLVNSLAEVPPLAIFPLRARDASLQPTGAYALESWSHAKGPRDVVSAAVGADLFAPDGTQWTAPLAGAPAGWAVRRADRAVTNAEDSTFTVGSGGTTYAHVSPWHGYTCVLVPPAGGAQPWLVQSAFGELHLAYIDSGDIHYKWSPFTSPQWQVETRITTDGGWSNPRMCLDHRGRIELRAIQSAQAFRFVSDDDGRSWIVG